MIDFLYAHNYEAPVIDMSQVDTKQRTQEDSGQMPTSFDSSGLSRKEAKKGRSQSIFPQPTLLATTPAPSEDCNTVAHATMYALGCKYDISSLKSTALHKFKNAATYAWDHPEFAEAIHIVYTTTPDEDDGLRGIVAKTILDHTNILSDKEPIELAIRSHSHLKYALWSGRVTNSHTRGPSCRKCGEARIATCSYKDGSTWGEPQFGTSFVSCGCPDLRLCEHHR